MTAGHTYTGTSAAGSYAVSVVISDPDGPTAKATSTAIIVPPLTGNGTTFVTTPGVALPANTVLATFADANSVANANPSLIKAVINWGDGQTSAGTVNFIGGTPSLASYTVTGSHTYSPVNANGSYNVTVTIIDPSQQQLSITTTGTVRQFINANGTSFTATVGQQLSGQEVATFTDTNPNANATNITALINWGDGQTSAGTVQGAAGNYTVTGNHTYSSAGSTGIYTVLVTIVDPTGQNAGAITAAILASPVTATGLNFTATVGQALVNQPVATFYDANPNAIGSSVVINWGDNQSTPGTVSGPNGSGFYVVSGSHVFSAPSASGSYPITVSIVTPSGQTVTAKSTATVAAPTIDATATTFSTTQALISAVVANFTDSNTDATAMTIHAVINWGDGTTTVGDVRASATPNVYSVIGSHDYTIPSSSGLYIVTVTIADPSGQTAMVKSTALVVAQVLTPVPLTLNFTAGSPPSSPVTLGYFSDSNAGAKSSSFTASINWAPARPRWEPSWLPRRPPASLWY